MRLDELVASGFCTTEDLDIKIKDRMRMLPEKDALDAIDEISGCSRKTIRNFASYFMGIMNRYMKGERRDPQTRGSNRVRDKNNRHQDLQGTNDPRFAHYGQPGRDGGRGDGGRDRRRDDDGRDRRSRRRRSRSRSRSYDSRSRSRSPDYRRRRRSRSNSRERQHSSHDPRSRTNTSNLPSAKPYGNQSLMMNNGLPPPPPPPRQPQPVMQHPMSQQILPGQPQMMIPGYQGQMQTPQQQVVFQGQIQPGQQFMQPLAQPGQQGAMSVQQMQQYQQLQQQQLLQQYIRQAPGGANNMQQMIPGMIPGSQVALATNGMLLGQPTQQSVNTQNNFALQNAMQQQQSGQSQPSPLDIFALADKASQALGRYTQANAPAAMMMNPNFPPMPAPAPALAQVQMYQQQSQHQVQHHQHAQGNEQELPMMVQYSLQNLRVSGHIDSTALDAPLVGMLKRLPENVALKSLETYSACDVGKMRNKGAYLSGILKKELAARGL